MAFKIISNKCGLFKWIENWCSFDRNSVIRKKFLQENLLIGISQNVTLINY